MKNSLTIVAAFAATVFLLAAALFASALIPNESLRPSYTHMLNDTSAFEQWRTSLCNERFTNIDKYADNVLLNIMWTHSHENVVESVVKSLYAHSDTCSSAQWIHYNMMGQLQPNVQYARYWHGNIAWLKPLLMVCNFSAVLVLNAVLMALLAVLCLYMLWLRGMTAVAVAFLLSLMVVSAWVTPFCVEYTAVFMIMFATAAFAIRYAGCGVATSAVYVVSGVATCFFDFLTTETLTMLVPYLLAFAVRQKQGTLGNPRSELLLFAKCGALWLGSYAAMWLIKWYGAATVFDTSIMRLVYNDAMERVWGYVYGHVLPLSPMVRNVFMLVPFVLLPDASYVLPTAVIVAVLIVFALVAKYIGTKCNASVYLVPAIIAIVPLVRFYILYNHATQHYFFTYRALLTTVLALALLFVMKIDAVKPKAKRKK